MAQLFWLSEQQLERIELLFPKSRGVRRVDGRKVLCGIISVLRHGLPWMDALLLDPTKPSTAVSTAGQRKMSSGDLLRVDALRQHRAGRGADD